MKTLRKILLWIILGLAALIAISVAMNWDMLRRTAFGGFKIYETTPPAIPADIKRPAILVFSKTNGFRHEEAIPAANALFATIAKRQGWGFFQTDNGATFQPDILKRFDAVVFNNVSGDVFTPAQRAAFKAYVENGGGFVGVHGAGGDPSYDWRWYVQDMIGAQFIGHPMMPQFQKATVTIEDATHPATRGLPRQWQRTDEWYSFDHSVRGKPGYTVLATLNEATYANKRMFGKNIAMGKDHPIVWWHCVGKGRVLYSALGHQAQAYAEPEYRRLLLGATQWAMRQQGEACDTPGNVSTGGAR